MIQRSIVIKPIVQKWLRETNNEQLQTLTYWNIHALANKITMHLVRLIFAHLRITN
jgi:hypothetical protein